MGEQRLNLADRNPLVADPGNGAEDPAGEQAINRGFAHAERAGGFLDRVGQPGNVGCWGFWSERVGLRCHGHIIAKGGNIRKPVR
jgi:hypothetical protein